MSEQLYVLLDGINEQAMIQLSTLSQDIVVAILFLSGCLIALASLWGVSKWM